MNIFYCPECDFAEEVSCVCESCKFEGCSTCVRECERGHEMDDLQDYLDAKAGWLEEPL